MADQHLPPNDPRHTPHRGTPHDAPRPVGELVTELLPFLGPKGGSDHPPPTDAKPVAQTLPPAPKPDTNPLPKAKRGAKELSKRKRNELERVLAAQEARATGHQEMGIGLRPLVMCGLPLKQPSELLHRRRCGVYTVEILGHPEHGLPFGQDRLLPIWISTAFVLLGCPKDNTIRFLYARDILRAFELPVDGRYYQRLKDSLERLSHAIFTIKREVTGPRGQRGEHKEFFPLLKQSVLWFEEPTSQKAPEDFPNSLTLSAEWADEIRQHPIPIDLETVRALKAHPGALDFYQWQAWRSHGLTKATRVPLSGPTGLFAQLGCLEGQPLKVLRRLIDRWQALISATWTTCPNSLSQDKQAFILRPSHALGELNANRFLLRGLPKTPK